MTLPTPQCPVPSSLQSTIGSVRSWLVLTVNSQWGWCFLSMRKELRHFLLFKQGPFFFQRTGKATRDSHSASNKPSTPVLGTKQSEWKRENEEKGVNLLQYLCSSSAWDSVVFILARFYPSIFISIQVCFTLGFSPFSTIYLHPLLSHVLSQLWDCL